MMRRPEMLEALEWADSKAAAERLQNARYQTDCGWYNDYPSERAEAGAEPWRRIAATLLGRR